MSDHLGNVRATVSDDRRFLGFSCDTTAFRLSLVGCENSGNYQTCLQVKAAAMLNGSVTIDVVYPPQQSLGGSVIYRILVDGSEVYRVVQISTYSQLEGSSSVSYSYRVFAGLSAGNICLHLRSVGVLTDAKLLSYSNYYPFGMLLLFTKF